MDFSTLQRQQYSLFVIGCRLIFKCWINLVYWTALTSFIIDICSTQNCCYLIHWTFVLDDAWNFGNFSRVRRQGIILYLLGKRIFTSEPSCSMAKYEDASTQPILAVCQPFHLLVYSLVRAVSFYTVCLWISLPSSSSFWVTLSILLLPWSFSLSHFRYSFQQNMFDWFRVLVLFPGRFLNSPVHFISSRWYLSYFL